MGLPYKLEVIKKLGCSAPHVLREYITSRRNVLEHEYRRPPERQDIRYLSDITELFLKATDAQVSRGYVSRAEISVPGEEESSTTRSRKTRVVEKDVFSLELDLDAENLSLGSWRKRQTHVSNLRTVAVSLSDEPLTKAVTRTVRLVDCDKEDLVALMRALREKAKRT